MVTFTYGMTPNGTIKNQLPHKYSMELTKQDMLKLLKILKFASMVLKGAPANWAMSMRTSILETIGIEEV